MRRLVLLALAGLGLQLTLVASASAQAWLPPKGEAWFSLGWAHQITIDHFFSEGQRLQQGHILTDSVMSDAGYAVTDRLTLRVNLPYVASVYHGTYAHYYPLDDGSTHGTLTDFRFGARFNVLKDPVALTPFVDGMVPSHHYEYFGHSIAGADLKQLLVGLSFGWRATPFLPRAYLHGRYSYAFVEKVIGISHNRSNLDLQLGYFVTPRLQLYALGMGQETYGGLFLDVPTIKATWTAADFHYHGQVSRSDLLGVGGGAVFQLTPTLDVSASYLSTVAGRNDHAINSLVSVGMTLGFSPRQVIRRLTAPPPSTDPGGANP
jgi:hypothetical protein